MSPPPFFPLLVLYTVDSLMLHALSEIHTVSPLSGYIQREEFFLIREWDNRKHLPAPTPSHYTTPKPGTPDPPTPRFTRLADEMNLHAFNVLIDALSFSLSESFRYNTQAFPVMCDSAAELLGMAKTQSHSASLLSSTTPRLTPNSPPSTKNSTSCSPCPPRTPPLSQLLPQLSTGTWPHPSHQFLPAPTPHPRPPHYPQSYLLPCWPKGSARRRLRPSATTQPARTLIKLATSRSRLDGSGSKTPTLPPPQSLPQQQQQHL